MRERSGLLGGFTTTYTEHDAPRKQVWVANYGTYTGTAREGIPISECFAHSSSVQTSNLHFFEVCTQLECGGRTFRIVDFFSRGSSVVTIMTLLPRPAPRKFCASVGSVPLFCGLFLFLSC